jgi:anaerobic sulfite reductase subunit B
MNNVYKPKPYKVIDYIKETDDIFTIKLDMKLSADPGQFLQVSIPGIGEAPISICSNSCDYVELNIRIVGNVTNALSKIKKGNTLFCRGPYGKGYPMKKLIQNNCIVIGGGCGVAPLKGVIEYIENHRNDYKDLHLFLGYRSNNDILFKRHIRKWQKDHNLTLTVDKKTKTKACYDEKTGFITEALKNSNLTNENKVVFICGPPIMMRYVTDILQSKGFNKDQIFISAERLMYCGVGVCCHCMIQDKFTCIDGPVFRFDELQ